ncbi:MAG: hypothetical protein KAT15_26685, partial [Bacteroidales bacterium]|nr:hypothetical protein [Bacteroidales bacterium]
VLMPQNEGNMENIRSFAMTSIEKGLDGLLLTLWDDDSPHFELYMRGIIAFAEYTWSGDRRSKSEIKSGYRHREFSSSTASDEYAFIDRLENPVEFWNNALIKKGDRRRLRKMSNPMEEAIIDLPDENDPGQWSVLYAERLKAASELKQECDMITEIITSMKLSAIRNQHRLEVYEQVNNLARFTPEVLLALKTFDEASSEPEKAEAANRISQLAAQFQGLREQLEQVFGETRILEKPEGYVLDQDHHNHLANQSISFDWLFAAEMLFLRKIENEF